MLVLYDLQEELMNINIGEFPKDNPYLAACGEHETGYLPCVSVVEDDGVKSVMATKRTRDCDGIIIKMPSLTDVRAGDRITITGRIDSNVPKGSWAMALFITKSKEFPSHLQLSLNQHETPNPDELFTLSYILDSSDLDLCLVIRTASWGSESVAAALDFYVDSILITRAQEHESTEIVTDTRGTIFSLANEESLQSLAAGEVYDGNSLIRRAGEPTIVAYEYEGRRGLHVYNRINDWDSIDIHLKRLNLIKGNNYKIKVRGRVDGAAPMGTQMMLQFLPGYVWRDTRIVFDNQEFTLEHTLSAMEVLNGETIRITTERRGADMAFIIYDIEIYGGKNGGSDG